MTATAARSRFARSALWVGTFDPLACGTPGIWRNRSRVEPEGSGRFAVARGNTDGYAPRVMDVPRRVRPPGGVRFAGWMIGIGAFFLCAFGVLLLLIHFDPAALDEAGIGRGVIQLIGFIMLAIGLLEFLLIYALWDGSNVARIITTVLVGFSLLGSLGQVVSRSTGAAIALIQLVISIAILAGLWADPIATEFSRRPSPARPPLTAPPPPPPPI
jgi:hypothetical protein